MYPCTHEELEGLIADTPARKENMPRSTQTMRWLSSSRSNIVIFVTRRIGVAGVCGMAGAGNRTKPWTFSTWPEESAGQRVSVARMNTQHRELRVPEPLLLWNGWREPIDAMPQQLISGTVIRGS